MNPILLHFASGYSLFSGGLLLIVLIALRWFKPAVPAWIIDLLAFMGLTLICLSGTPAPLFMMVFLAGSLLIWLVLIHFPKRVQSLTRRLGILVAVWIMVLLASEMPYVIQGNVSVPSAEFHVIGDSLSAGIGGVRWPDLLGQRYEVRIHNWAVAGATASSAMAQAERIPADGKLILVEIGGNDLLGGNSAKAFGRALDELLKKLEGHPLVMFELPLYPWLSDFGYQQRRLAMQYHVLLIPKRKMCWVYSSNETTVDGIHLSELGAQRMADVVSDVLRLGKGR